MSPSLAVWSGFAEADPRVLGVLVAAVGALALAYTGRRLYQRRAKRRTAA